MLELAVRGRLPSQDGCLLLPLVLSPVGGNDPAPLAAGRSLAMLLGTLGLAEAGVDTWELPSAELVCC